MIKGKLLQYSAPTLLEIFFQFNSSTKQKLQDVTLNFCFQLTAHSAKHWSNEQTMVQYVQNIIVPYVENMRDEEDIPALVIMDNFKGQINTLLEENNTHVVLLPPNTTDRLQPLDISVNKPAKDFLRKVWYSEKILDQVEAGDTDISDIDPINLGMPVMKELGAKWLVEMFNYLSDHPEFIVNGFLRSGITGAINVNIENNEENAEEWTDEEESDDDINSDSSDSEDN